MKNKTENINLSPETLSIFQDLQRKQNEGEVMDPHSVEALKAINLASKVVNAIMSGNQIDPVFFKKISDLSLERIQSLDNPVSKKIIKKKKKLKRKTTY